MNISRDRSLLCPAFVERLKEHDRLLAIDHLPFVDYECLRSWERQEELWAQGRTTIPGSICTNARGGMSWHQYGLACDRVLNLTAGKPSIQWSWDTKKDLNQNGTNDWLEMGKLAELAGLEWSGRWRKFPELPHIQMTGGLTIQEAQELYRQGDLQAIWEEVSLHRMG